MTKVRYRLRLVAPEQRPLAALTRAEKLAEAIAWLRSRNLYVLDRSTQKPTWGVPYSVPPESSLMKAIMEADRRRK